MPLPHTKLDVQNNATLQKYTNPPTYLSQQETEYDYPHILPTSIPMDKNFANKYRYVCLDENDSTIPFLQSFEEKIIDIIEK